MLQFEILNTKLFVNLAIGIVEDTPQRRMSEELPRKARLKGTPKKQMPKNSKKKNEMLIFAFQNRKVCSNL
jgi:hypothetical protein